MAILDLRGSGVSQDGQVISPPLAELGSGEHIKQGLMGFADGVRGGITNPLDQRAFMISRVMGPAFESKYRQFIEGGGSTLTIEMSTQEERDKFKVCAAFFTEMAKQGDETIAIDSILVGSTGKVVANPSRDTDSLIVPVDGDIGTPNRHNFVDMYLTWGNGQAAVAKPKTGSGESLKGVLGDLTNRLNSDRSRLLLAQIRFVSIPTALTEG